VVGFVLVVYTSVMITLRLLLYRCCCILVRPDVLTVAPDTKLSGRIVPFYSNWLHAAYRMWIQPVGNIVAGPIGLGGNSKENRSLVELKRFVSGREEQ